MSVAAAPLLHTIPISQRPRNTWRQNLNAILFFCVFQLGCLMINAFQLTMLLPMRLLPFSTTRKWYDEGVRYSKGAFGALTILMSQWFAPSKLVVTFEREGRGRFSDKEIAELVVRDTKGRVVSLHLPQRAVMIANHQTYNDWWYAWGLTYFMGTHKDVFIVLKKSLKWVPIVGWGMQIFNFIFLARSWASDRLYLANRLSWLGQRAEKEDTPLTFLLYPEGTLISKDTRPISKKYAEKLGIPDMVHTLLPRSTGLHHSLRSLVPRIPSLQMIDITVAYPGIPAFGYGQSYYTLRSTFFDSVPPPTIHMHIRRFDVAKDVPVGDLSKTNPNVIPVKNGNAEVAEIDIPDAEREQFDLWLRELWRDKDKSMTRFLDTGSLADETHVPVEIPLELRHRREILDTFCFFVPALVYWFLSRLSGSILRSP